MRKAWVVVVLILTWVEPCLAQPSIATVEVVTDDPARGEDVPQVLGLELGSLLDKTRLRLGIQALYATGEIEQVTVSSSNQPQGVAVVVDVSYKPTLSSVVVDAPNAAWRRRVGRWIELRPMSKVSVTTIETGIRRAVRELRSRGYTAARVEPFLQYSHQDNTVALTVQVTLGRQEQLRTLTIDGLPPSADPDTANTIAKPGRVLTDHFMTRLRQRVLKELHRQGFWQARVLSFNRQQDPQGVDLVIAVDPGPQYHLELSGSDEAKELLEEVFPDPAEHDIHPAQLQTLSELLTEELQRKGYLLAKLSLSLHEDQGRQLRVHLEPGKVERIAEVRLDGATALPSELWQKAIAVRPGRLAPWRGREVTQTSLEEDRHVIEHLYRTRGYANVEVMPARIEPGPDGVSVVFQVSEGQRWNLAEVQLQGFPVEAAGAIEKTQSNLVQGGPWDEHAIDPERRRLEVALANAGYPEARVDTVLDESTPGKVRLVLQAHPGPFVRFSQVVIAGLKTVRTQVVERALTKAGVTQGEPFSLAAILEAQRLLYELGVFSSVELAPVPGQEQHQHRGLVVRCEEGPFRSTLFGIGWDTADKLRFTLGWTHLNLGGRANSFSFETRVSGREQRFQASLRDRSVLGTSEPGVAVVYRTEEEFSSYSQQRRGLWYEIGERRRKPFRRWLRLEYQRVRPDAPPEVLSELERRDQEIQLASISPFVEWDTRNDPLAPTQGTLASLSVEYAFPALQAEVEFVKLRGSLSLYSQLAGGVAAAGIRVGAVLPVDSDGSQLPNLQMPINVRFFSGGRASHRSFATDSLGIAGQTLDDDRNPIGGNALLLLNVEYQHPLGGPVAGVVFSDIGNVWAEPSRVRVSDLRVGAGLGVRVDTPAGPLRLEYGLKLDRQPEESRGELFLSFGVPF